MWPVGGGLTPDQQQQMLLARQQAEYAAAMHGQAGGMPLAGVPAMSAAMPQQTPPPRDTLKVVCDSSMNLEQKLFQNIQEDYYAKGLALRCPTFDDLVAEAKEEGTHTNAWGGMRGDYKRADNMIIGRKKSDKFEHDKQAPAKLWCILYRMFQLRLSSEQLESLLKDNAKACLKALGILYVRLTQPHEDYVQWLEGPLRDTETVVQVAPMGLRQGTSTTVDKFTRNVILEVKYLDTRFPRIPELKLRKIKQQLAELDGDTVAPEPTRDPSRGDDRRGTGRREREDGRGTARAGADDAKDGKAGGEAGEPRKRRRLGRLAMELGEMRARGAEEAAKKEKEKEKEAEREREAERRRDRDRRMYAFEERVREREEEREQSRRAREYQGGRPRDERDRRDRPDSRDRDCGRDRDRDRDRDRYNRDRDRDYDRRDDRRYR